MRNYGYWTYENCKEEVLSYVGKTIKCLRDNSGGCYDAIWRNGWTELLDYIKNYNKRKYYDGREYIIYIYEMTEYNSCYIGLTSQPLNLRHYQHMQKSKRCKDTVAIFCDTNNIGIPYPKFLEDRLDYIKAQEMEATWIKRYKDNGWVILNRSKVGKGTSSLGGMRKVWDYDNCKEESKKYNTRTEFEKGCSRAYQVSRKNGWLKEFFPTTLQKPNGYWNYERCVEVARKCKTRREFKKKFPSAYSAVCRCKFLIDFK